MIDVIEKQYHKIKETKIYGRWIRIENIEPLFQDLAAFIQINCIGKSEENRSIYKLKFGTGTKKILIWSQMHGNESTGTKAIFDLLNYIKVFEQNSIVQEILNNLTIEVIPILNPDGAQKYTRVNANNIDLNRDAVDRLAIESKLLRKHLEDFKPQFCFNLHDQRTIFGVSGTKNPATISFLAPSENKDRKLTKGRIETMDVIIAMNSLLQKVIPGHVGRYTDEFYPTATGDNFQKLGYNTILIEAGHYYNDYKREEVRKYNFYALLKGLNYIARSKKFTNHECYFKIPNNTKSFVDVIHRTNTDIKAFMYKEQVIDNHFLFNLEEIFEFNNDINGHTEVIINNDLR